MVPDKATKAHPGRRITVALNLNLGSTWRRVVNITPRPVCTQERSPCPFKNVIVNTFRKINTNIAFLLYFCLYYVLLSSLLANKLIPIFGNGSKIKGHVNKKYNGSGLHFKVSFLCGRQEMSDTNKTTQSVKNFGKKTRTGRLIYYIQGIYGGYTQYMSIVRTLYQRI